MTVKSDQELRNIFKNLKTMVMVGVSASPLRASFFVARYFVLRGIRIIPVNPKYEGSKLWGEKVLRELSDINPEIRVDMVDIFRPSTEVPAIVAEVLTNCFLKYTFVSSTSLST